MIVYIITCVFSLAVALERKLSNRKAKEELMEKNILHGHGNALVEILLISK